MKVEYLRPFWTSVLLHEHDRLSNGFKNWLAQADYDVDRVDSSQDFVVSVKDKHFFASALASDVASYGIHALQSIHSIQTSATFPKINAWHLIKAYYAAYFAAHTILRLTGRPFTNLESGHVKEVLRLAQVSGAPVSPKVHSMMSGNYELSYDSNQRTIVAAYKADSHKDLWATFHKLISKMSIDVLRAKGPSRDLQDISGALSKLVDILDNNGGLRGAGNWLSVVRNEVNYRTLDDIWFPFKKNSTQSAALFIRGRLWRTSAIKIAELSEKLPPYERFFLTCLYIVQLMNLLVSDYGAVSKECRSFKLYSHYVSRENGSGEI